MRSHRRRTTGFARRLQDGRESGKSSPTRTIVNSRQPTVRVASNQAGFTLLEMMIVVGILSVVLTSAVIVMPGAIRQSRADAACAMLLNTLKVARDRSIDERRNMELVFVPPNRVQVVREGVGGASNQTIVDVYLESGQQFKQFGTTDTPSLFGLINSPIAFGPTQGTLPTIMFTSEGSFVDGSGDPINGTIFLGNPGDPLSARAITIFGPTALLRSFRWNGRAWEE